MSISSVSVALTAAPSIGVISPLTEAASSGVPAAAALAAAPVDTVTLSPAAQQSLASATVASTDGAAPPDALTQAIAALNDTSGSVSVADQLQAYGVAANFVQGPQVTAFEANWVPGQSAAFPQEDYNAAKGDAIVALIDSPFAQHAQQLLNQVGAATNPTASNGDEMADSIDSGLTAFNSLSATDQQIYLGTTNLLNQLGGSKTPLATVADYQANQEAQANLQRALQAALTNPVYATAIARQLAQPETPGLEYSSDDNIKDLGSIAAAAGDQATVALVKLQQSSYGQVVHSAEWTQQVQSYFAQYGPPPAAVPTASTGSVLASPVTASPGTPPPDSKAIVAALAAIWDTTGRLSVMDQAAAQQTVTNWAISGNGDGGYGVAKAAAGDLLFSPFQDQVNAASADFFWNPTVMTAMGGNTTDPSQSVVALLDKLPQQQQELIFLGNSYGLTDINAWKAELANNEAMWTAYNAANPGTNSPTPSSQPVSGSDAASIASSAATASAAAKALAALISPKSDFSGAEVALVLMQNAAKATATAKAANYQSTSDATVSSIESSASGISGATNQPTAHKMGDTFSVTA